MQIIIAALLNSKCSQINITQNGSTECGPYDIAMVACLAFREDPTNMIFDQVMLRSHLGECFMKGHLQPFQRLKTKNNTKSY